VRAPKLLLASISPRRRQLLELGGWKFTTADPDVDETQLPGESPAEYVLRLAEAKARAVAAEARAETVIIGSDTTVVDAGEILGKPADEAEAAQMLRRLRGHAHQVYTGIAALRISDGNMVTDLCVTDVPMRDYSDAEIESYVETGDPLDKAGAYAIQNPQFQPVERMEGCYASVMGLALCHLMRLLRQFETAPLTDLPLECQMFLDYSCPVSAPILRGESTG
jgi:MAF protein